MPDAPAPAAPGTHAPPGPPPSFPPSVKATLDWLQSSFAAYYKRNPPRMPHRFARREFGFILWPDKPGPPPFVRHRAYDTAARFQNYLGWKGPHSCYYSTAYYRRPGEMRMLDKQWLGAELIFDLDADHLVEAEAAAARGEAMGIEAQLELVKTKFRTLLEEFLLGDLGIDADDVWLTFSGGRGYHAHVVAPALMQLDQKARREVVDYVTGKVPTKPGTGEAELEPFLAAHDALDGHGRFAKVRRMYRLHGAEAPGWQGRLHRGFKTQLQQNVFSCHRDEARAWLLGLDGIGEKKADAFLNKIDRLRKGDGTLRGKSLREGPAVAGVHGLNIAKGSTELAGRTLDDIMIGLGNISSRGEVNYQVALEALRSYALPMAKGETDEPVTADIKRLIRLPDSLHGKSGLRVVRLTLDELKDFDPFRDAVAFGLDPVRFTPRSDGEVTLAGETVRVEAGQETEVPTAHAVWWCARQQGTVHPPPSPPPNR